MKINYKFKKPQELEINEQELNFKDEVRNWYQRTINDPTAKNSAIFYGQGGTGKTTLAYLVAKRTNKPLFICFANSSLAMNFNDKLEGRTAKDKFKELIAEIEAGIYDNSAEKIKTNAEEGYILLIESAEQSDEWNFLQEVSSDLVNNKPNKQAVYIFLTDIRSPKEIKEIPYLYKSNLNEVFFSFQLSFLKTLLEKEEISVPNNFPNLLYDNNSLDLVWHFTFSKVRDFARFWRENDLSNKLTGNNNEINKKLTLYLEKFWLSEDEAWFINNYKLSELDKQRKINEELERKISQIKGDLCLLYYEVGNIRKQLDRKK